jgi:hypothetical protein
MGGLARQLESGSRAASYLLGAGAIALAGAVYLTSSSTGDLTAWMGRVLGWSFVTLAAALIGLTFFCWVRLLAKPAGRDHEVWLETGIQAANGVATLALTFTLLGISLGIGTLATQELTPETVQVVIREMTANFSMAFMTTVVGLPVSALLRGLIVVTEARNRCAAPAG